MTITSRLRAQTVCFAFLACFALACGRIEGPPLDVDGSPPGDGNGNDVGDGGDVEPPCVDGTTRTCGVSIEGACTLGIELCRDRIWQGCDAVFPVAEQCNGVDDDCVGGVPELELDGDGDGVRRCGGDCDDLRGDVRPGATELCDGVDNDCSGGVSPDERDQDLDGVRGCQRDCDDLDSGAHPGAVEVCDGVDNNCDGRIDEQSPSEPCADGVCPGTTRCQGGFLECVRNNPACDPECGLCPSGCCNGSVCEPTCQ